MKSSRLFLIFIGDSLFLSSKLFMLVGALAMVIEIVGVDVLSDPLAVGQYAYVIIE